MTKRVRRRVGRPPATDGEETRRRIIEVAQRCFGDKGFDRATTNDIADGLGLTGGSMYHYFGSKAALYNTVCKESVQIMIERLEAEVVDRKGIVDKLVGVLETSVRLNAELPSLGSFLVNAPTEARRNSTLRRAVDQSMGRLVEFLGSIVDDALIAGELGPGTNRESVVGVIYGLVLGMGQLSTLISHEAHRDVILYCERLIQGTLFLGNPAASSRPGRRGAAATVAK